MTVPTDVRPVVVGVDGSADSRAALVHALVAAARRHAELRVVSTVSLQAVWWGGWPLGLPLDRLCDDRETRLHDLLADVGADPAVTDAPRTEQVPTSLEVAVGPPAARLVDASAGAGLLVVGTHGRGVARDVLMGSHCPVLVVRAGAGSGRSGPVLVGVDGSSGSRAALAVALVEASRTGADVVALAAFEVVDHWVGLSIVGAPGPDEVRWQVQRGVEDLVADALLEHRADHVDPVPAVRTVVVEGRAADVLVGEAADLDAALLVVGSTGRGELRGLLVGSVALDCAARATGPVLVVRPVAGHPPAQLLTGVVAARG